MVKKIVNEEVSLFEGKKNKTKSLSQNPTNITQSLLSLLTISVRQIYILAVRQCSYLAKWYTLWVYWPFVKGGPPGVRGSRGLSGG